jgi:glutamate synthase domain-containing protein 1
MANGIQAIGHNGRTSSISGAKRVLSQREEPINSPNDTPKSAAARNPIKTLRRLIEVFEKSEPDARRSLKGCIKTFKTLNGGGKIQE